MGYFDGLTDGIFKRDSQNHWVFYPHGVLAKGYILKSEEQYYNYRDRIKKIYMISFPLTLALVVTKLYLVLTAFILGFGIWYYVTAKKMTKNLTQSTEKLKIGEAYKNSARSHNYWTLIFFEFVCVLFVLLGLLLIFSSDDAAFIGIASVIFFGLGAIAIGYMVLVKRKERREK